MISEDWQVPSTAFPENPSPDCFVIHKYINDNDSVIQVTAMISLNMWVHLPKANIQSV